MNGLNFCFIVCGPSGVGKTTLVKDLLDDPANRLTLSVSYTTRALRGSEVDGEDYFFVDVPTFEQMVADGKFAEWANVHGNMYGTAIEQIEAAWADGQNVLFDIDFQGARQLQERFGDRAISTLVVPPSIESLEQRLRDRKTDDEETIQLRLKNAIGEMRQVGLFDYVLENDDLALAQERMRCLYVASCQHRALLASRVLSGLPE